MKEINYKELDKNAILKFLREHEGEIEVSTIMSEGGADRLRVYPLIYELVGEGVIKITKEGEMGTPLAVSLC